MDESDKYFHDEMRTEGVVRPQRGETRIFRSIRLLQRQLQSLVPKQVMPGI